MELYLLGGIAAIVLVAVMVVSVGLFVVWPNAPGSTATVAPFTLAQENTAAGLTALDLGVSLSNLLSSLLGGLSLLTSSWLMLRSRYFGRASASIGMVGNATSLGFLLSQIGAYFAFLSMVILAVRFILIERSSVRLSKL